MRAESRSADHVCRKPARVGQARRDRARDRRSPGRDRLRRDGLGQDHPVAEDLPGARPRPRRGRRGPDRPHAAAPARGVVDGPPDRRGARHAVRRGGRLQGALHRQPRPGRLGQADDGRDPARRDADRPAAEGVRHPHHRRGARAQPEHRFPARLPPADPAEAAGPEADRHVGDDRRRALRAPFRQRRAARAGDRGERAAVSGRGALPADRRRPAGRRPARGRRELGPRSREERARGRARPDGRHRRRGRRAVPRGPRRRARVPARRARDPRRGRGAAQAPSAAHRDPAAVRAAVRGRAGARVQGVERAADRARDERRRNVADRAGHPLCRRHGLGAREALFVPEQGRAVADRADLAGGREPARGPLRPRRRRRLHPPLRGKRFRRPRTLHRSGNPALVARVGDPADEIAASVGDRIVSVHRAAAGPRDRGRLSTAQRARRGRRRERAHAARPRARAAAARSARRPDDPRRARPAGAA
ncbi:Uncharacterised protein [Burkholderia pseudomallei]|nr:Uncharacterised protein [Burkholderia pseudomallei]